MKKAKYIVVLEKDLEVPIVFSPFIEHNKIANGKKVLSAGLCSQTNGIWSVWGNSVSLRLEARIEDVGILNRMLEYNF
jgi:hypothetical protein